VKQNKGFTQEFLGSFNPCMIPHSGKHKKHMADSDRLSVRIAPWVTLCPHGLPLVGTMDYPLHEIPFQCAVRPLVLVLDIPVRVFNTRPCGSGKAELLGQESNLHALLDYKVPRCGP